MILALNLLSNQPVDYDHLYKQGEASYYTVASSSKITASGEKLNDEALTCAMRTGKFGTYYKVVADNGKSVVVRLNDRGPYKKGRIIDLTRAAMERLTDGGLVKVKVYASNKKS